jgi:hypothetical protein
MRLTVCLFSVSCSNVRGVGIKPTQFASKANVLSLNEPPVINKSMRNFFRYSRRILKLMSQIDNLKATVVALVATVKTATNALEALSTNLKTANAKVADLQGQLTAAQAQIAADNADVVSVTSDLSTVNDTLNASVSVSAVPQPSNAVSNT